MLGETIHFYVEFLKKLPCEQVKVFFSNNIDSCQKLLHLLKCCRVEILFMPLWEL